MVLKTVKVESWIQFIMANPDFTGCVIDEDYSEMWWLKGRRHREDGPAIIWYNDNERGWYLDGVSYSEQEWIREIRKKKLTLLGV